MDSGLGFKLTYESSNTSYWSFSGGACGGNLTNPNGILTSPSYPYNYPNNQDCVYTITQSSDTFLNLKIFVFDLTSKDCPDKDYLQIRDGISEDSPLIGQFCGTNIPKSIQTTQNDMWIRQGH